jgi:hypothetical protein
MRYSRRGENESGGTGGGIQRGCLVCVWHGAHMDIILVVGDDCCRRGTSRRDLDHISRYVQDVVILGCQCSGALQGLLQPPRPCVKIASAPTFNWFVFGPPGPPGPSLCAVLPPRLSITPWTLCQSTRPAQSVEGECRYQGIIDPFTGPLALSEVLGATRGVGSRYGGFKPLEQ